MKPPAKHIGTLLVVCISVAIIAAYAISCMNAGYALSFEEFSEGGLVYVSNCGGNSAAGSTCRNIALAVEVEAAGTNDVFDFDHASPEVRNELTLASKNIWTSGAKYLLRKGPVHAGQDTHDIVVVCDTAYGNVPQPSLWNLHHRTLAHAAGYSDGSLGWLTPEEFTALNKSNFLEISSAPQAAQSRTNVFQ